MKKMLLLSFLSLFLITGCSDDDSKKTADDTVQAKELLNVSYGNDARQKLDLYLPAGRNEDTKVILLLHGGSWVAGNKNDMDFLMPGLQQEFPNHAIVNIGYRLATDTSPAYPKQTDDIAAAIKYLEESEYMISHDYAFIGISAGAHLAMLYSYKHDNSHDVKAVCNIVGPADFTDPEYLSHPLYASASQTLVGTPTPTIEQITTVNPVSYVTAQSPATISFYGGIDPLVPATQGPRLKAALDNAGVYNEFNFYENGGHANWDATTTFEVFEKMAAFLTTRL